MKNDSDWIFQHLLKDERFEQVLKTGINVEGAVGEAFDILHGAEVIDEVTDESCFVIAVLTQWLTCYLTKRILQLMTPESLILNENLLPSHYIHAYLNTTEHFNLLQLINSRRERVQSCKWLVYILCNVISKLSIKFKVVHKL